MKYSKSSLLSVFKLAIKLGKTLQVTRRASVRDDWRSRRMKRSHCKAFQRNAAYTAPAQHTYTAVRDKEATQPLEVISWKRSDMHRKAFGNRKSLAAFCTLIVQQDQGGENLIFCSRTEVLALP